MVTCLKVKRNLRLKYKDMIFKSLSKQVSAGDDPHGPKSRLRLRSRRRVEEVVEWRSLGVSAETV